MKTVFVLRLRDEPVLLVEEFGLGICQDNRCLAVENFDTAGEKLRRDQVVVRRPPEVRCRRHFERELVVAGGAENERVSMIADASITLGVRSTEDVGLVGRSVVADDELEILECLFQNRIEGFGEVALAVVHGEADADAGSCCHSISADWLFGSIKVFTPPSPSCT